MSIIENNPAPNLEAIMRRLITRTAALLLGQPKFYGIYRGLVIDNLDPAQRKRLKVKVPAVENDVDLGWALPCIPNVSEAPLPAGAAVWVMFEGGDPIRPVWMGTYVT